jgi:hypothetical protein
MSKEQLEELAVEETTVDAVDPSVALQEKLDAALSQISKLSTESLQSKESNVDLVSKLEALEKAKTSDSKKATSESLELANQALKDENQRILDILESNKVKAQQDSIKSGFNNSKFVKELAVPVELVQSFMSKDFSYSNDGVLQAKDASGNVIMSSINIGQPADFNEAIEKLVNASPLKDSLIASKTVQGSQKPSIPSGVSEPMSSHSKIMAGLNL